MTLQTLIDTADRFNWSERQRVFDDDGFLIQEVLTFDDGRVKTTTLADGVIVAVSLTDPLNVASLTTHSTTYDALTGQITGRSVIYDDGRTLIDTFVNGIRSTRTLTDTGDAHVWASRELIYDASGALSQKIDTYDDGRVSTSSYTAQVLTTRTVVDTNDRYGWAQLDHSYDPTTGQLLSVQTTYDSGLIVTRTNFDGPAGATVTKTDAQDLRSWATQTVTYDALGQIEQRVVTMDDDVRRTDSHTNGVRTETRWEDLSDIANWAERSATYDTAGRLASLRITFDDGSVSQRRYSDGVLVDRTDGDAINAYSWSQRSFSYNADGQIEGSAVLYDDNTVSLRLYTDGVLTLIQRHDYGENFGWESIETRFDTNGVLLHTTRTEDDGSFTTRDARGLDVFEGTLSGTVVEDSAITLTAAGAVTFVDGYRGSQTFNGFQNATGLAGLGSFTVNNDGTWTYTAINNQFGVQTLNAGETITDSVQVTTHDGATVLLTVDIQGQDDSAAPIYLGNPTEVIGAVGSLAAPLSFDLGSLFSDDQGEDLTITLASIPAGFTVVDGIITATGSDPSRLWGTHRVEITATDSTGQSITQTVDLVVGAEHFLSDSPFDPVHLTQTNDVLVLDDRSYSGPDRGEIFGYAGNDTFLFGDYAAQENGTIAINGGTGDDTYQFEYDSAFQGGSITITEEGAGNDSYQFGPAAAPFDGVINIIDPGGHDTVSFGDTAAIGGSVSFEGASSSGGADITFGAEAASQNGSITLSTGAGVDVIAFGASTARDANAFGISTGAGEDRLTFGDSSFHWGNRVSLGEAIIRIDTGADDDRVAFGNSVSQASARVGGETTGINLQLGSGNDTAIFGTDAGSALAQIEINAGTGDDTITFGERAGTVIIEGGTGADMITFADRADDITVDFGADTDADSLTMGFFTSLTLTNYDHTIDSLSVARVGDWVWHVVDDGVGTTTLQASGGPLITFTGTTGVAATDLLAGVNVNREVEFIGTEADKDLGVIGVGNATPGFSTDIRSLFADQDITDGLIDTFSVSAGPMPTFMAFDGTTFSLSNETDAANVGLYSVNFTARDIFGAGVTETFTFEVGLNNTYGDIAPVFYLDETITGSDFSDVMTVGTVNYLLESEGAGFYLDGGARHDVLSVGDVTMASNFATFRVQGGTGDDQITIASFTATGTGTTQSVVGGDGADTITFNGAVQGLTVDLGLDTDADTLIFNSTVTDVTIQNWVQGTDTVDVLNHTEWSITSDDGTNTVLSNGTNALTFAGVTGLTDVDDFLI